MLGELKTMPRAELWGAVCAILKGEMSRHRYKTWIATLSVCVEQRDGAHPVLVLEDAHVVSTAVPRVEVLRTRLQRPFASLGPVLRRQVRDKRGPAIWHGYVQEQPPHANAPLLIPSTHSRPSSWATANRFGARGTSLAVAEALR